MRSLVAVAVVGLVGCGGGMDPEFAGTWTGILSFAADGAPTETSTDAGSVTVSSDGRVSGFCLDGSGSVDARMVGPIALYWVGNYVCPAGPFGGCESAVFTFTEANVGLFGEVAPDGSPRPRSVYANFSGSWEGCGKAGKATWIVLGEK